MNKRSSNNGKQIKLVYNLILYIGLFIMALGFILFMVSEMEDRRKDRELFHQQQLTKSFERNKNVTRGEKIKERLLYEKAQSEVAN